MGIFLHAHGRGIGIEVIEHIAIVSSHTHCISLGISFAIGIFSTVCVASAFFCSKYIRNRFKNSIPRGLQCNTTKFKYAMV